MSNPTSPIYTVIWLVSNEIDTENLVLVVTVLKNDTMQHFRLIAEANTDGPHEKGNTDAYVSAIKKVHVLLFGMGQPGEEKSNSTGQDRKMIPGSKLNSSIACIRQYIPSDVCLDLDDLEDDGVTVKEGAGMVIKATGTGVLMSMLGGMAMLMLLC